MECRSKLGSGWLSRQCTGLFITETSDEETSALSLLDHFGTNSPQQAIYHSKLHLICLDQEEEVKSRSTFTSSKIQDVPCTCNSV